MPIGQLVGNPHAMTGGLSKRRPQQRTAIVHIFYMYTWTGLKSRRPWAKYSTASPPV